MSEFNEEYLKSEDQCLSESSIVHSVPPSLSTCDVNRSNLRCVPGAGGGGGGGAGGGGAGGIEALLGSLGPKGGALGYVGKALAVKRHVDSAWAVVKRWTPLLFLGVLLLLWFKPLAELVTALLGK